MKELKSIHRVVARYLAMGVARLPEICDVYGLNLSTWTQITGEPIFKAEIARLQRGIEERMLTEIPDDPIFARLKLAAGKAVDRLVAEIDNDDPEMASAATKIKASNSVLDRLGYNKSVTASPVVTLTISEGKLNAIIGTTTADKV